MLYHMDIGFPPGLRLELPEFIELTWSKHAIKAAQDDRYAEHGINLFSKLKTAGAKIVELETVKDKVVKIVLRQSYDDNHDICLAIAAGGVVKTVWLNVKSDSHSTLDVTKYGKV